MSRETHHDSDSLIFPESTEFCIF